MKKFLSNTPKLANARVFFAPIVLFITGILCMSQNIKAQSALDGFSANANGKIRAIVVQPDGKIIIGGDFTAVGGASRNYIARINPNGTIDSSFAPNPNYYVFSLALQPDGKIIAGGYFTQVSPNGGPVVSRNYIARFNADGSLDTTFDPNANGAVYSIVVQPDGFIVAGGDFTSVSPNGGATVTRNNIARFVTDGTLDPTFDPNVDDEIYSMAIQPDGKIIIAGDFYLVAPGGGTSEFRPRIARINPNGSLDAAVNIGVNNEAYNVSLQPDGKFIVGGIFTTVITDSSTIATRNRIVRFNADGTLDTTFNPNINGSVLSAAIQPDGKIIVGGNYSTIAPNGGAAVPRSRLARLNQDGTLENGFNPSANAEVSSLAVQSDGKVLVGGAFNNIGGAARTNFARLEKNSMSDATLNPNPNNVVYTIALQTDGKILVGGDFTGIGGTARNRLARLTLDGNLDGSFNANVNGIIYAMVAQTDGKILIGGDFTSVNGTTRNRIARLNANGTTDTSFNPGANNSVRALAVQPDGKILVGGTFTIFSGATRNYIARLTANGSLDGAFNPNANNHIHTITVQPNGKILLGGEFSSIAGMSRNFITRLNTDGTLDYTFYQNTNGGVTSLALQSDGKILIGGSFTNVDGVPRNRMTRLNADGSIDIYFYVNPNAAPNSIAVQSDGKILIGGDFTTINGMTRSRIARLNGEGSLDASFNPGVSGSIRTLALQPDGKILVGGQFNGIGFVGRNNLARLTNTTAAISTLDIYPTTLILARDGAPTQFSRVVFEQSVDNGINWTTLGTAGSILNPQDLNDKNDVGENPFAPTSAGYILTGQNIPTGQNVLIRARGFYRTGERNGSENVEDKVQNVFLPTPNAANISVSGRVMTYDGAGLRNALVQIQLGNGEIVTARTSAFGYFQFNEIAPGQMVFISVKARNYSFTPETVTVNDNITDLIFTSY